MKEEKVGFAIIGGGLIASFHMAAIAAAPHAELRGVFDLNHSAAEKLCAASGTHAYSSLEELLDDPKVQVVTIATPSGTHGELVCAAARAGKHILCEKPLEVTREKVYAMAEACRAARVLLVPVFQNRFKRPVQRLRQAIADGLFGKMIFASAQIHWFREEQYYSGSSWRGTWKMDGGGALINQGIHTVDLLLYLNGAPKSVFAYSATRTHSIEVEDTLCATIQFQNGSFGTLETSTSCSPGFPRCLCFTGTQGSAILEGEHFRRWNIAGKPSKDAPSPSALLRHANDASGSAPENITFEEHTIQMEDIATSVLTGKRPLIDVSEGIQTMELIFGIYDSIRSGTPFSFHANQERISAQ
ncbi:MAG: Gfo/Idh/MocA family oxidoreductase [Victivallales bacterium]|nr:Gfo/Idh/MocA family oxidoreductase [Victivallales bacterium]